MSATSKHDGHTHPPTCRAWATGTSSMCTPGNDLSMDIAARRPSESFCEWRSTPHEVRLYGTHNTAAVHMAATHKVQHVQQAIRKEL